MADPTPRPSDTDRAPPRMPRWVKLFVIIVAVLVVGAVATVILSGGQHGPGRHVGAGGDLGADSTTVQVVSSGPPADLPPGVGH